MAEYRITYWAEIPSLVTARAGDATAKAILPERFQDAIDEAAMRRGLAGADGYLEQWRQGAWEPGDGAPDELAQAVARRLDEDFPADRLEAMLDG